MLVRIPFLDHLPGMVRPRDAPILIQIIAEIPGNVRERSETCDSVTQKSALVFASSFGVNPTVIHIQDQRNNYVPVTSESERTFELLPIGQVKSGVIEARMEDVFRQMGRPWRDEDRPIRTNHVGFAVEHIGPAGDRNPHSIDFQVVEPLDNCVDHPFIRPPHKPVRGGAVEKVMLPGTLPYEMPRVLRIHPDWTTTISLSCVKRACRSLAPVPLPILHEVSVFPRHRRHESYTKHAAVFRVTEPIHLPALLSINRLEPPTESHIRKRVSGTGRRNVRGHLHEIVRL